MHSNNLSVVFVAVLTIIGFNLVTSFNLAEPVDKNNATSANSNSTSPSNITAANNATNLTAPGNNTNSNGTLDDRFNFNLNLAGARGVSKYGGVSQSDSLSWGNSVGIKHANGQYQNLYSKTGSNSNSFSQGPGAPLTFAQTQSMNRPGFYGGKAAAGLYGGIGQTYAQSHNQQYEIPLDNRGTVLLSNLKERDNSTSSTTAASSSDAANTSPKQNDATSTTSSSTTAKGNQDSLVFNK